jgi:hypothetical protein
VLSLVRLRYVTLHWVRLGEFRIIKPHNNLTAQAELK